MIEEGLYEISKQITLSTGEDNIQGILGGEYGYGVEFKNDIFEMHPFYYDDCSCGFEDESYQWQETHPHDTMCYQQQLDSLIRLEGIDPDDWGVDNTDKTDVIARKLARSLGLSDSVTYTLCTCNREALVTQWYQAHGHKENCLLIQPNFWHYASGTSINWYKYIGRSMKGGEDLSFIQWIDIVKECLVSLDKTHD